jgi:hypothetical protein
VQFPPGLLPKDPEITVDFSPAVIYPNGPADKGDQGSPSMPNTPQAPASPNGPSAQGATSGDAGTGGTSTGVSGGGSARAPAASNAKARTGTSKPAGIAGTSAVSDSTAAGHGPSWLVLATSALLGAMLATGGVLVMVARRNRRGAVVGLS